MTDGSDLPSANPKGSASGAGVLRNRGRFFAEAEDAATRVPRNPQGFHFIEEGRRRVSLESFPYHFVFEEKVREVRFLVLRHDKRHPAFGLRRE